MNTRRVHQFVREHFPTFDSASMVWENVADMDGPRISDIRLLLSQHLGSGELIVEVHRKLGGLFSNIDDAASYIGLHISEGEIKATNRQCSGFVVVALNGVACGWHADNR